MRWPDGSKVMEIAYRSSARTAGGLSAGQSDRLPSSDTEKRATLGVRNNRFAGVLNKDTATRPHGGPYCSAASAGPCADSTASAVTASGNICVATLNTGHITVFLA